MEYRFVPFDPAIDNKNPTGSAANALASIVKKNVDEGWEFVGIENHSTEVPGNDGCFGFGSTSPYLQTMSIAVFKR